MSAGASRGEAPEDEVLEAALERMPEPSQAYLDEIAKKEAEAQAPTN